MKIKLLFFVFCICVWACSNEKQNNRSSGNSGLQKDSTLQNVRIAFDAVIDSSNLDIIEGDSLANICLVENDQIVQQMIMPDFNGKSLYFIEGRSDYNSIVKYDRDSKVDTKHFSFRSILVSYSQKNPWGTDDCQTPVSSPFMFGYNYSLYEGAHGTGVFISSNAIFPGVGNCSKCILLEFDSNLRLQKNIPVNYDGPTGPRSGCYCNSSENIFLDPLYQRMSCIGKQQGKYFVASCDSIDKIHAIIDPVTNQVYYFDFRNVNKGTCYLFDQKGSEVISVQSDSIHYPYGAWIFNGILYYIYSIAADSTDTESADQFKNPYIVIIDLSTKKKTVLKFSYKKYLRDMIPYSGGLFFYMGNTPNDDYVDEVAFYDFKN